MRVALVHDYLNQAGGAERVAALFCSMFPEAPLYTSVYDPASMPDAWRKVDVRTSFMQRISPKLRIAKRLLPLYPFAFESFDLSRYDLVLSSSSTFAKGVITSANAVHVCYCHNTTRALWMYHDYVAHERIGSVQRALLPGFTVPLRQWDYAAAQRVDHFVANSRATAARIHKYYRREATIIEPPIRVCEFAGGDGATGDYFLVIARLQSYKRIDLAVHAANRLRVPLIIAGTGPDKSRLAALAGPSVRFLGRVSDTERVRLLQRCRALVVPGREDFGLTALEAQAAGRPVIAFRAGGSLETVIDGLTGMFFSEPTAESLTGAMRSFERMDFNADECRKQAARFDEAVFIKRMRAFLTSVAPAGGNAA